MISVQNVTKTFDGFAANKNLTMHVQKGSIYGLVGPNGAGKTTIIKQLAGVFRSDSGEIMVDGQSVFENAALKARMITISDDLFFYLSYTIKDMARLYRRVYLTWNEERFSRLTEVFDIDPNRRVSRLSKGMQKQVAFWLGISTMPDVLILDEPVDGLDPVMRRKVWSLIMQDVAERETTVLLSSHNLRELEDVCDHVGIMHQGEIVLEKRLDDVKSDVHKLQVAFEQPVGESLLEQLKPLHTSQYGSVNLWIVRGDREALTQIIQQHKPLFIDILPLTLEEIFIYELGGLGYEINEVIL